MASTDERDWFTECCASFDRDSRVAWVVPTFSRATGCSLSFLSRYTAKPASLLDLNQNAGCGLFGHYPLEATECVERYVEERRPMRLPLASCEQADALGELLIRRAFPSTSASSNDYSAIDLALSLSLLSLPSPPPPALPLQLLLLHGSFHGNCTHAAFSSTSLFREQAHGSLLSEFEAVYLPPSSSEGEVEAAFSRHDAKQAICFAVLFEPLQHSSRFQPLPPPIAAALMREAQRRRIPCIADEIWSGLFRTGPFVRSTQQEDLSPTPSNPLSSASLPNAPPSPSVAPTPQTCSLPSSHLSPDIIVLGKGLSFSLVKHSALLVRKGLLPSNLPPPPSPPPCGLSCSLALSVLSAHPPHLIALKAQEIKSQLEEMARGSEAWLLPIRGGGFSYEFELRATAESRQPACGTAIVTAM
ncbi:MAG: hypothetical protein SGPRY_010002, partial [Prymnesium sp.]